MRRLFVVLGLLGAGAAALAATRRAGTDVRRVAKRGVEAVRERAPAAVSTLAHGIEGAGAAAEKVAEQLRAAATGSDDQHPEETPPHVEEEAEEPAPTGRQR